MNRIMCPHEENISRAARTGRWDDSAKGHIRQCASCREIAEIAEWMGNIACSNAQVTVLPDPGQVFLNARISATERAREKAVRPLVIAEFVVRIMVALALAVGVLFAWFGFRAAAACLLPAYLHVPKSVLLTAAALVTSLIALVFTKLVQPMLIEE